MERYDSEKRLDSMDHKLKGQEAEEMNVHFSAT